MSIETDPAFQAAIRSLHEKIVETMAPSVLVIDDCEDDVIVLRYALLEEFPHMVIHWRSSAETALSVIRTQPIDIVLLDLRLGLGLTGVDVLQQIRAISTVPVAGYTGMNDGSDLWRQAMKAGIDVIFPKPLDKQIIRMLFGKLAQS